MGAQVAASVCAAFALKVIFHPIMGGGVTVPSGSWSQAFALEFMISFNLMFVVTAVATDTRAVSSSPYFNFYLFPNSNSFFLEINIVCIKKKIV